MGIEGYARPDGSVGIRNYVAVLASVSCANGVVDAVKRRLPAIRAITHTEGCGRGPRDLVVAMRTLCGLANNPNVAGVLVVGLGCEFLKAPMIADELRASGKPVAHLVIQENHGSQKTIQKAIESTRELLTLAEAVPKKQFAFERLTVGVHFDTRTQEGGRVAHATLWPVADWLIARGCRVLASEPRVGYERSSATVRAVLEFGEKPSEPGLSIVDTPANGVQALTGIAASGAQLIIQLTESGTPGGIPVAPVLKVSTSSRMFSLLGDDLDLDAGSIGAGAASDAVSGHLIRTIERVVRGDPTRTEQHSFMDPIGILTQGPAF